MKRTAISGGTLSVAASSQLNGATTLAGGTLSGSGDITNAGTLAWTGGTMSGSGKTIIASGATLNMINATVSLNRILQNDGTTNWTTGSVGMTNGTFNNNNVFVASTPSNMSFSGNAAAPSIMRAASPNRVRATPP